MLAKDPIPIGPYLCKFDLCCLIYNQINCLSCFSKPEVGQICVVNKKK